MERGRGTKKIDRAGFRYQFVVMGLILFFSYTILTLLSYGVGLYRDGIDILDPHSRDLDRFALFIWPFDQGLAEFADDAHQLLDAYVAGENIFIDETDRLERVWGYIAHNHERLSGVGFDDYEDLFVVMASLYPHRDEVYELLGSEQPFTYLIALQNTGERRPNGGFFGSFVIATIDQGKLVTFQPVDSYFPNSIAPGVRIPGPLWGNSFLDDNQVGFVAGNKYGFTDVDGRHLKILYELIFNELYDPEIVARGPYADVRPSLTNKYIKGVIFLRSDMREDIVPGFQDKTIERQFVNATIDLIRGDDRTHKKELYMNDMTAYFQEHYQTLMLSVLSSMRDIRQKHYINIYLSNVSDGFEDRLRSFHFTTTYDKDSLYLRDFNRSYSKVDRFLTKEVRVSTVSGQLVADYVDQDIIPVGDLQAGSYMIDIYYNVNVPEKYSQEIARLADTYDVNLSDRERAILHLQPNEAGVLRATQGLLYLPGHRSIDQIGGDIFGIVEDASPFARIVSYRAQTPYNNTTSHVTLTITIPKNY